jgi:hypothetical protein
VGVRGFGHQNQTISFLRTMEHMAESCQLSMARGCGGWCYVACVLCRHGHGPIPLLVVFAILVIPMSCGHGGSGCPGRRCHYPGLLFTVVLWFLVLVIVIVLHCLVSNNKMKEHCQQLLGSFFGLPVGGFHRWFWLSSWGCSQPPLCSHHCLFPPYCSLSLLPCYVDH